MTPNAGAGAGGGAHAEPPPRAWPVLAAYVLAFIGVIALSLLAGAVLRDLYPDLSDREVFDGLPGLLGGGLASAAALLITVVSVSRPLQPERLRLTPGRETARGLALMIVGTIALGQVLDSATTLAGLGGRGSMLAIRRALEGATGSDLFSAVLVIGPIAGAAEEIFFRGYMQTALARCWRPWAAVVVTSAAFALMHMDPIHGVLALVLGLWLGAITERANSALPALASHVLNNTLFTLLTALGASLDGVGANLIVGAAAAATFVACAVGSGRDV